MSPEEIKEYERMGEENIRCMSRFALAHGYKITEDDEMKLGLIILSIIKAKRTLE